MLWSFWWNHEEQAALAGAIPKLQIIVERQQFGCVNSLRPWKPLETIPPNRLLRLQLPVLSSIQTTPPPKKKKKKNFQEGESSRVADPICSLCLRWAEASFKRPCLPDALWHDLRLLSHAKSATRPARASPLKCFDFNKAIYVWGKGMNDKVRNQRNR